MAMQLEIYTPERKVFEGDVKSIQLPGLDGLFEILPHHASLIAALAPGQLKIKNIKDNISFYEIKGGFVEVLNNKTSILVEGAKHIVN